MKIVSVSQMRDLEAAAFAGGTLEDVLQERAGAATAAEAQAVLAPGGVVAVLVGGGNNGRDGAVAARRLAEHAIAVQVFVAPRHAVRDDELAHLRGLGVRVFDLPAEEMLREQLLRSSVVIDGLVGIGARGALREPYAAAARAVNAASLTRGGPRVVSIDLPSGIDPDTGEVPGDVVRADRTVTFGAVKQGLLRFPAAAYVGHLAPREIGIPHQATAPLPYALLEEERASTLIPPRPLDAHKYRFGRVLVVAGSEQYVGAAVLCASAAARSGAGLITLASTATVRQVVATRTPEVTYVEPPIAVEEDPNGSLDTLMRYVESYQAVIVGPGFGRSEDRVQFLRLFLEQRARHTASGSLVLDADALYALVDWPEWWKRLGSSAVLTPHSAELRRLAPHVGAGSDVDWVEAASLSQKWGCTLIAKGPHTVVASPSGTAEVWGWPNPGLASGGTGDVLAGLCAGLLAQGCAPWDGARLTVAVHALAAAAVVEREGVRSLLASDLLPEIPRQLGRLARIDPGQP